MKDDRQHDRQDRIGRDQVPEQLGAADADHQYESRADIGAVNQEGHRLGARPAQERGDEQRRQQGREGVHH
jgi:hypothetical protein